MGQGLGSQMCGYRKSDDGDQPSSDKDVKDLEREWQHRGKSETPDNNYHALAEVPVVQPSPAATGLSFPLWRYISTLMAMDMLTAWGTLYGLAIIIRHVLPNYVSVGLLWDWSTPLTVFQDWQFAVMVLSGLACCSGYTIAIIAGTIGSLSIYWNQLPSGNVLEPDWWRMNVDVIVVVVLCCNLLSMKKFKGLTTEERDGLVTEIGSCIRPYYVMAYSCSGFWKLNEGFFDFSGNCGSLMACYILSMFPYASSYPSWLIKLIVWSGPFYTVTIEMGLGVLFSRPGLSTYIAIAVGLFFHILITCVHFTDDLLNVDIYAVQLSLAYFFFLPLSATKVLNTISRFGMYLFAAMAVGLGFWVGDMNKPNDRWYAEFTFTWNGLLVVYLCTLYVEGSRIGLIQGLKRQGVIQGLKIGLLGSSKDTYNRTKPKSSSSLWWFALFYGFFFNYGLVILGLVDFAPPKPFTNLRVYGGSNHFLLPTGLVLKFCEDSPLCRESSWGGGVVRIEEVTGPTVTIGGVPYGPMMSGCSMNMTDEGVGITNPLAPKLCKVAGHNSLFISSSIGPAAFGSPYVNHALELRRSLADLRSQFTLFELVYTKLPHYDARKDIGSNTLSGQQVRVRGDGTGKTYCSYVQSGHACGNDELANLPPPGYIANKLSRYNPYPVSDTGAPPAQGYCLYS